MRLLLSVACGCFAGCGNLRESYGKEYVLYDSRRAPATAGAAPSPADSSPAPTATSGESSVAIDAEFARILELENVRGEIERAILEGLDRDGTLARKRRGIDEELRTCLNAAGDRVAAWRAARAEQLRAFALRPIAR